MQRETFVIVRRENVGRICDLVALWVVFLGILYLMVP
jgi:hypothetical protein